MKKYGREYSMARMRIPEKYLRMVHRPMICRRVGRKRDRNR